MMRSPFAALIALAVLLTAGTADPAAAQQAGRNPAAKKDADKKDGEKKTEKPVVYRIGDLTLSGIWSRQASGRNGAAFLDIKNAGEDDDSLIDASTPVAKRVELHGPANSGETWQTSRVDEIPTPGKQDTLLTGSGLHLRLIGLRGALKAGEIFPITLTFERAGAITVQAKVLTAEEAAAMTDKSATGKPGARKAGPRKPAPTRGNRRRSRRP